ncbi:hypothetical protein DOTSEDRAFT_37533 [Dothistroma septosporum NZE10]|uniref:Uncharacterized protein n=1 Tax=Dothistroma septosporum (strain NZE10 / CBS 128990) TaxID=675120 RepID=N1PFA2_DOTSN|nr:hypothetical protein DOTSEDRAFT_37533 [Dothistroma septosporum NZE10]
MSLLKHVVSYQDNPVTLSCFTLGVLSIVVLSFRAIRSWRRRQAVFSAKGCQRPQVVISALTDMWSNLQIALSDGGFHDGHMERYRKYGATYESSFFGFFRTIYTTDPDNVKAILGTDFAKWGMGDRRRLMLREVIVNGIFVNDGERWEHSRSLLRPSFKKVNAENAEFFERHFRQLLQAMPEVNPFSGLVDVDLQPLFLRMTHDSATELFLGKSMNSQLAPKDSEPARFLEVFDYCIRGVLKNEVLTRGVLAPLGLFLWVCRGGKKDRYQESCESVQKIVAQEIQQRLEDFKSSASGEQEEGDGRVMSNPFVRELSVQTDDQIRMRDEIISVLFAGRDSTGSLLSNAMFMLARRRDVWDAFRAEVKEAFEERLPDFGTLRQMKVLDNILKETLRLYPPVPANYRAALVDTTLPRGGGADGQGPIAVPAGTGAWYHPHTFHRSVAVFGEDANEWEPSRWQNPSLKPGWAYLPFNGGPRICPGQTFAVAESSYILARMAQEFKSVERRDPNLHWRPRVSLATCHLATPSSGSSSYSHRDESGSEMLQHMLKDLIASSTMVCCCSRGYIQ